MGAAGSVQSVYRSGAVWFKEYFDTEKYIMDFHEICGRDSEGVIHVCDFRRWIISQAEHVGGYWNVLLSTNEVVNLAFEYSCVHMSRSTVLGKRVVDITHFRTLLVQLFVVSVLWSIFRKADSNCLDAENPDAFNNELNFDEFAFAMRTFCVCYAQQYELSDEEIRADFQLLDEKKTGHVQFSVVCRYCSKFMQQDFCQQFAAAKTREQRISLLTDTHLYAPHPTQQSPGRPLPFPLSQRKSSNLSLQHPEKIRYTMEEAPIELIIDLQSHPSDEEREYLPALALSRHQTEDDEDDGTVSGIVVERMRYGASTNKSTPTHRNAYQHHVSHQPLTSAALTHQRQKRMNQAMACLSAKIEEDLEKMDLVSMRMATWQTILQSPSSSKLFSSVLSPKSGRTFPPI
jgi:hypothetical protein